MLPTSKTLQGHIAFVLSVRASMHACVRSSHFLMHAISYESCMLWVLKFHIVIPHGEIADPYFFFLFRVISISGVMSLKRSE